MAEADLSGRARGGKERTGALIECFDPATLERLGLVPVTAPAEVPAVVARAQLAQRAWGQTSFAERRRVLGSLLDAVLAQADALCDDIARDSGKTRHNAMVGEIWPVVEKLRWTIKHGERHLRDERVSSGPFLHKRARVAYEPLGVIGVIAPWNYPLQNILGPTVPALMAGNAVVIKASEHVAWSSARFLPLVQEVLVRAGHAPELVQIIHGYAESGAALIGAGVQKVIFTGSLENGKRVLAEAAKTLTPVVLELGGKDPLIVCDDAELEQAVHAALAGAFINCGQNCLASERLLVFSSVYEEFVRRLTERARALRQGPPLGARTVDCGAVVSPMQLTLIDGLVRDAVERGARVLVGGGRAAAAQGQFFEPTVLAEVTPEMRIAREETFGPVAVVMRVDGEEHALELANATAYGLGATVLTRDARRAKRMARALTVGNVSINDFGLTYMAMDLPFGGIKGSGFGRLNGREGLRACTNPKAILEDRLPLSIPAKVYPIGDHAADTARDVLGVLYARGLSAKLEAAGKLLRSLGR